MQQDCEDWRKAGTGQGPVIPSARESASTTLNRGLGKEEQAYGRQKGMGTGHGLRIFTVFTSGQGGAGEQEPGGKKGWEEGVRLGVIKAAGKGSVQPSAGGIKGTQSGHKGH